MKTRFIKSILTLLMALTVLSIAANDYLKIYFKDGHTERHFMKLVENITVTKYDLEGNLHSDYQMQQIITADTTYSYYLADIDSMAFRKYYEEQVRNRVESFISTMETMLEQNTTMEDLVSHMEEIKNIDGVEEVYYDGENMFIQIRDWLGICFTSLPVPDNNGPSLQSLNRKNIKRHIPTNKDGSPMKVTIGFQMTGDDNFTEAKEVIDELYSDFSTMGYNPKYYLGDELNLDFFYKDIFDSNVLLIDTHGGYGIFNKKHYLYTGIASSSNDFVGSNIDRLFNISNDIDLDDIGINVCHYKGDSWFNNPFGHRWYYIVREDFIRKSPYRFTGAGPHMVFIAACSSLQGNDILTRSDEIRPYGNDTFAQIFFDKGADVYLGYNNGTYRAAWAAYHYFHNMLLGASAERAFKSLDPLLKYEEDKEEKALLVDLYNKNSNNPKGTFIVNTHTVEKTEQECLSEYQTNGQLELIGKTFKISSDDGVKGFGFRIGTKPDVDKLEEYETLYSHNAHSSGTEVGELTFSAMFTPEGGKTYYYRAFTGDGLHLNWGEERILTVYNSLQLSTSYLSLKVGETKTVQIVSGNGSYEVKSSNENIATASVSGNTISINGLQADDAIVTITDIKTSETATIAITVTEDSFFEGQIVLERKYMVDSHGDVSTNWEGRTSDNYAYQSLRLLFDNDRSLQIGYLNAYYWDDSRTTKRQGVYIISYQGDKKIKEWYIEPRRNNTWIKEKIVIEKTGKVRYYSDDNSMGEEIFSELELENAKNVFVDVDPYGWWYTHYHHMDDFKLTTPAKVISDNFDDGIINTNIWQQPKNPDGVREEDGIMKTEQLRTDKDFHLRSNPIPLIGPVEDEPNTSCPDSNHPHMIDLGLPSGTKWACCNVGASKPEDYGDYYAWGETQPKEVYNWRTYIHCDGSEGTFHDIGSDIAGTQYDAATANWGAPWRMPSKEQFEELISNCTSVWTTENGVNGRRFTGTNGTTIFLPAAGFRAISDLHRAGSYGYYYSSTIYESYPDIAWRIFFDWEDVYTGQDPFPYRGQSVRPVRK